MHMHELGLAYSVFDVVAQEMSRRRGSILKLIELSVGRLSGVDAGFLKFSLEAILRASPYVSARVEIVAVKAYCRCAKCGNMFEPPAYYCPCPVCGSHEISLLQGGELKIRSLVIETA